MADKLTSMAYENLNRRIFPGVGEYGIPQIYPETFEGECEFIGFNYARGKVTHEDQKGVHFFWMTTSSIPCGEMWIDTPIN